MIVQFAVLVWRGFNHLKILDWNVNKYASWQSLTFLVNMLPSFISQQW
jgi:hypothetical protein